MGELRHDFDGFHSEKPTETLNELGEKDLNGYTLEELDNELSKLSADLRYGRGELMESTQKIKDAPKRISHLKAEIEKRERIAAAFAKHNDAQELEGPEN